MRLLCCSPHDDTCNLNLEAGGRAVTPLPSLRYIATSSAVRNHTIHRLRPSSLSTVHCRHRMSFPLIRPPLQTRRNNAPHPSAGGRGTGYDQTMRELVLAIHNSGNSNDLFVQNLRQQRLIPSLRSEYRYSTLNATRGHVRACRRTGNNRATVLRGHVYSSSLCIVLYFQKPRLQR